MKAEKTPSNLPGDFTFSQSSLQDYMDCPRRFQLRYLEKLAWPAVETEPVLENEQRQQEGLAFHRLVQQHLLGLPVEKLARMATTPDLARWWDNYLNAKELLESFKQGDLFPELTLAAPVSGFRLVAKYDLVIKKDNGILIIDWKTFRKRPRDEVMASRLQTRVYRSLLVTSGKTILGKAGINAEEVSMDYWYSEFPDKPTRLPYSDAQFTRDWKAIGLLVDEINSCATFPLTDDEKKCLYCKFRSYCNRGSKAGSLDESENEAEDLFDFDIDLEQVAEIEF